MITDLASSFELFQNLYNAHKINMKAPFLDLILQDFTCYYITKDNHREQEVNQKINQSKIIIIKKVDGYLAICFDKTLVIILESDSSLIQNFFDNNKNSTIFTLEKNMNDHNNSSSIENQDINTLDSDIFIKTVFDFSQKFLVHTDKKELEYIWFYVRDSISGYFIRKSYQNCNFNRVQDFQLKTIKIDISPEKYITLQGSSGGSSSYVQFIYSIPNEQLLLTKTFNGSDQNKLFQRELSNYSNIRHPFLPKFYRVTKIDFDDCLVIEYIKGHSLNYIKKLNLSFEEKLRLIFQILIVIEYLHNCGFVYRDLKPDNIILDQRKTAVLIDFDRMIKSENKDENPTIDFSPHFVAPEITEGQFSYKSDIYSIGRLIYFILHEKVPDSDLTDFSTDNSILYEIYQKCTQNEPEKRPKISQLIDQFYSELFAKIPNQLSEIETIQKVEDIHSNKYILYWSCLAQSNDHYALTQLGILYEKGDLLPKDEEKANNYFSLAKKMNISQIKDEALQKAYSNFDFIYLNDNENEQNILDSLKPFKFMTFSFSEQKQIEDKTFVKAVICAEKVCFIINSIEKNQIQSFLTNPELVLINVSQNELMNNQPLSEEVSNFCKHFQSEIKNNQFVQMTIFSVSAFLIRRFYTPSFYFNDQSFYSFGVKGDSDNPLTKQSFRKIIFSTENYEEIKEKFRVLLPPIMSMQADYQAHLIKVNINHFKKSDFIFLREIKENSCELILHIESLHLFALQKIGKDDDVKNKVEFYEKSSHECFKKFYGYLEEDDGKKIGFIFEFMSNGSLLDYITKNRQKIGKLYSFTTLIRVFLAILHLHSNYPKYKDINASNILIDHDFIPYASYEYEPSTYSDEKEVVSFSKIIDLLFENIDSNDDENNKKLSIPIFYKGTNPSKRFHAIKDPTIDSLKNFILEELAFKQFAEYYLINNQEKFKINEVVDLFYELIHILVYTASAALLSKMLLDFFNFLFNTFLKIKGDYPEIYYQIGYNYENGIVSNPDFYKARQYYEYAAKNNNNKAIFHIGHLYELGNGVKQDYSMARKCYETAAIQKNLFAIIHLALLYENGYDVNKDPSEADKFFLKAIEQNKDNSEVPLNIGHLFYFGKYTRINYTKAIKYYEISAENGNANALYQLGYIYENGIGVERDYSKAKYYYDLSGKYKYSEAYYRLGNLYYYGRFGKQDYIKAREYYEMADKLNNPKAPFQLGVIYKNGLHVPIDQPKANTFFKSFTFRESEFCLNIGLFYENGYGVDQQNYTKAMEYYQLAVELGNSKGLYHIGLLYKNGYGVEQSNSIAEDYFNQFSQKQKYYNLSSIGRDRKDSKQHFLNPKEYFKLYESNNSDVLLNLGLLYEKGHGIEKDYKKAKQFYELSSEQKHAKAYYYLGHLYEKGLGVEQNYSKAKDYYEIAACNNNRKALLHLGKLYEKGLGVEQNYLKAKELFEKAAQQNNFKALFRLGKLYLNGIGIEKDIPKALENFTKCINLYDGLNSLYYKLKHGFYYYLSNNNLGLIYTIENPDNKEAFKYFSKSGKNEYPYGQNCLGLFYQFFPEQNKQEAKYFFQKASGYQFAMAEYNLGFWYEKEEKNINESMIHYTNASNIEDADLVFKNKKIKDEFLRTSQTFIICLANLKLVSFHLTNSDNDKARLHFNRALSKLVEKNQPDFTNFNLRSFILNFPDFNLNINEQSQSTTEAEATEASVPQSKKQKSNDFHIDKMNKKKFKSNQNDKKENQNQNDDVDYNNTNSSFVVENTDDLFDLYIHDSNDEKLFIQKVNLIIQEMSEILYTPPYRILFGRMNIRKAKSKHHSEPRQAPVTNQVFLDGFGMNDSNDS